MKMSPRYLFMLFAFSPGAFAHVKWFVQFDTTKEPESIIALLSEPQIGVLLLLSVAAIFVTSWLDRRWPSPVDVPRWQNRLTALERMAPYIMRYGTGLFFLTLTLLFPYIMLTPELVTDNPALRYVHFLIALTAFHRRTSIIAGLGILFLYSYAVQLYGTFHMLDYLVFVGTAVYLIMQSFRQPGQQGGEIELLRLTLCYSFLWGAIEKFMQPALFDQLLTGHPYLTMGIDWEFFVRAAGFVEFCLAWHILTGRLAGYISLGALAVLVLAAIIPFGTVDFIGHFLFVVPLIAVAFTPRRQPVFATPLTNTLGFLATLVLLFAFAYISYYILHYSLHPHLFH